MPRRDLHAIFTQLEIDCGTDYVYEKMLTHIQRIELKKKREAIELECEWCDSTENLEEQKINGFDVLLCEHCYKKQLEENK